jgi:methylthioribose-1-phosphate isomerase
VIGGGRPPAPAFRTLHWIGDESGSLCLLDQTLLPGEEREIEIRSADEAIAAIRRLAVRGAPALGVAGAYALVLGTRGIVTEQGPELLGAVRAVAGRIAAARPTAINLPAALERSCAALAGALADGLPPAKARARLLAEAQALEAEERAACERMGHFGAELLRDGDGVLTHCNAGALATVGLGTALAPLYVAHGQGKHLRVFADETRPLLQGARLTAWELARGGLDVTVITDGMAGAVLQRGWVQAVLVGSDRIARNGDVANKIGTYSVAVLAVRHGVPFYVVAPLSTFDPRCATGADIPIEERDADEVARPAGAARQVPADARVFNPAFDVTPAELVRGIVTEHGVLERPDEAGVLALLRRGGRAV